MGIPVGAVLLEPFTFARKTSNYTIGLADWGVCVEMNLAGANTWTLPQNSSVALPIGFFVVGSQYGAGLTTVTPGSSVNLRSRGGALISAGQYAMWQAVKVGTDEWYVSGDLVT